MVLDQCNDGAKRLVLILCLPLIDGVFATLLVTGAIETFTDIMAVALTVFTGAGALAVLYAHAETREEARGMVLQASAVLVVGAVAVALVAPVFEELFYLTRLRTAAGLALLVIAGSLAGIERVQRFSPAAVLLTGFALSVKNPDALQLSTAYVGPALVTAAVAAGALYAATFVRADQLSLSYVRRGGAVAVLTIALSMLGMQVPSGVGLAAFGGSLVVAYQVDEAD